MIFLRGHAAVRWPGRSRLVPLLWAGSSGVFAAEFNPQQQALQFNSGFMRQGAAAGGAGELALRALTHTQSLGPGRYWVDIQVNQQYLAKREIRFVRPQGSTELQACLSAELLDEMGVKLDAVAQPHLLEGPCVSLPAAVPLAQANLDAGKLLLAVSIPQIALRKRLVNEVPAQLWDHGINSAFISYQVAAQQGVSRYQGHSYSDDLYLNSGVNLGAWRLRSNQAMRRDEQGERNWTSAYTYLQRDVPGTRANVTVGQTFSGGDVFRSVPIQGILLASDPGMLSDLQQGYAPVIRGVALSRSKLEVFQNGYPIYSTYVSPGPYAIDDLSTVGGGGELEVVLTESDGNLRRFTQPYATLGNLLREGTWRYSAAVGRYNAPGQLDTPLLGQGTLAVGTAMGATLYGGLMASDFYQASNLGVAQDIGHWGALAMDVTRSSTAVANTDFAGLSYAVKYGKAFSTRTNLRFAGYRYSTQGYRDFDEAVRQRSANAHFAGSRRSRLEASLYQPLGNRNAVSLTLSQQDYWGSQQQQRQYQFNFNTHYRGVSYTLYASQALNPQRGVDRADSRQFGLSLSLPIELGSSASATFDVHNSAGQYQQRASLGGTGADSRLNYRVGLSNNAERQQEAQLGVGYQAHFGAVGAGLTQGQGYRSASLNASGAVLLHGDGLELGPHLGETMALVHVPQVAGVGIQNATGVRTNTQGYALVPSLRPYRRNHLVLETDQLGPQVEIDNGSAQVVPRRGAVVKASFAARTVHRLVITARDSQGAALPFGAQVSDAQGAVLSVVGQAGQVLLATSAERQTLQVRWGKHSAAQCSLDIDPASVPETEGYRIQSLTCL